ncbi:hypothetical protein CDD83_7815 [Cordyceps sp. RAO-2017]|nr:hypothetical protein CDD83_7815 [Cordyceps sp. RAO-2017]
MLSKVTSMTQTAPSKAVKIRVLGRLGKTCTRCRKKKHRTPASFACNRPESRPDPAVLAPCTDLSHSPRCEDEERQLHDEASVAVFDRYKGEGGARWKRESRSGRWNSRPVGGIKASGAEESKHYIDMELLRTTSDIRHPARAALPEGSPGQGPARRLSCSAAGLPAGPPRSARRPRRVRAGADAGRTGDSWLRPVGRSAGMLADRVGEEGPLQGCPGDAMTAIVRCMDSASFSKNIRIP